MTNQNGQKFNADSIGALLVGDFGNASIAMTSGGIEAQEAMGQSSLCENAKLPLDVLDGTWSDLEILGVQQVDTPEKGSLFVNVVLPLGWKKEATELSALSELVDEKGRTRASICYKEYPDGTVAHMILVRRYSMNLEYEDPADCDGNFYYGVKDEIGSQIIYRTESIARPANPYDDDAFDQYYHQQDELRQEVKTWLSTNFPDWKNATAYWD